ncbi:MAG: DNA topoisomerase I [Candidatus Micrarchaeota archaeon]|nr:DNA topoisomerase I [Candidatus Micrarchaeota archaeon]
MKFVVCEKPNAAEKVALALGKAKKRKFGNVSYWEVEEGQEKIVVVSAVGHLYTLKQKEKGWSYPVFDVEWVPSYEVDKDAQYQKAYLEAIKNLSVGAEEHICACDYDTEGSLIGYNVLRFACKSKRMSRMKFSTLTKEELRDAWRQRGEMDLENALAGEARHILDWYYGINLSRALMASIRKAGAARQVMSIGRVQGPALAILAKREREIESFVPQPYWEVWCKAKGIEFQNAHGRYLKKEEAEAAVASSSERGIVKKIEKKEQQSGCEPPFDLTSLQLEAYKVFGFDPKATLDIAQQLYENALISYPRTSSQKLPAKLDLKKILWALSKQEAYRQASVLLKEGKTKPAEGKKTDPAHPAIHPTGEVPAGLDERQAKLYDLIVRRFLACFEEPAIRESQKVVIESGKQEYVAMGVKTKKEGWMRIYRPYVKLEEKELPPFAEKESVLLSDFRIEEKMTQPPKRYTTASLVAELERRGLGTKATRATIIETLFKRGYIDGKSIKVTPFGLAVYDLLAKLAPQILDEKLTREIEEEMEKIKDGENEKKAIDKGKEVLKKILAGFEAQESKIGGVLLSGLKSKEEQENTIGDCPSCQNGKLRIIKMKDGRQFVGCTNYPSCTAAFNLPQKVKIRATGKKCQHCGMPTVSWYSARKKIEVCINPACKKG